MKNTIIMANTPEVGLCNRLAGNLTPADRQSAGWLWDEAAQRPVWESSPPLRWQPLR